MSKNCETSAMLSISCKNSDVHKHLTNIQPMCLGNVGVMLSINSMSRGGMSVHVERRDAIFSRNNSNVGARICLHVAPRAACSLLMGHAGRHSVTSSTEAVLLSSIHSKRSLYSAYY